MAKYTLLQMTQKILSAMDSDEVETITETIESQQVVDTIERVFEEMLDRRNWEFMQNRLRQLDDPTSAPKVQLDIPSDVMKVDCVRYKNHDTGEFDEIPYVSPKVFMQRMRGRDATQTEFESAVINDGVTVTVYNERRPNFYTSFNEKDLIFDAYDSGTEALLTGANSQMIGEVRPTFTQSDAFVPDIPERMFSYLLHESMSTCFLEITQKANPKAETVAQRQYRKLRQLETRTKDDRIKRVNHGR